MKTDITPSWKQKLLMARAKWFMHKYEAAKDFGVPSPKSYTDQTTNGLTRCIIDWLRFNNHYANRLNSQGQVRFETIRTASGATYKKANFTRGTSNKGTADINAIINGRPVAIEVKCKATNDKMRPEQLKEKRHIESAGGIYYVAKDMESFMNFYEENFIPQLETRQ